LLYHGLMKNNATNVVTAPLQGQIDLRTGRLKAGLFIEVRCLRVDAAEWRYELGHCWPAGISLFVGDTRVLLRKPDAEHDENPGPFDLTNWVVRSALDLTLNRPFKVSAAITAKKGEMWALALVLAQQITVEALCAQTRVRQIPRQEQLLLDLERVRLWVTEHRPDRVDQQDTRCVEPPVLKLTCCTSLCRMVTAVRGADCDHLQCFDLGSYLHTMRSMPPKHLWCCPVCDKPAPIHRLRFDAFAQSVLDSTEANVTEVLVADNGKWTVSAKEEDDALDDDSDDVYTPPPQPTQADLQQAALNLGRAFAAPAPPPPRQQARPQQQPQQPAAIFERQQPQRQGRDRSRSPRRKVGVEPEPPAQQPLDKMVAWERLQGLRPEQEVIEKKEETRFGWLPEGVRCTKCDKAVVEKGGVYCGRKRPDGSFGGCFNAFCWKCMNKCSKEEIGGIKTTKTEFGSLGPDAWWMHERCMRPEDRKAYFGEDDDDDEDPDAPNGRGDDSDDDDGKPGKFAWE